MSRPKNPKGNEPPKAERVRIIVEMMAAGRWVSGVTGPSLADLWGIHWGTVGKDAAEASRIVRAAVSTSEDILARALVTIESIQGLALDRGELRTALDAAKALVGVADISTPRKLEVKVRHEMADQMDALMVHLRERLDDAAFDSLVAAMGGGGKESSGGDADESEE